MNSPNQAHFKVVKQIGCHLLVVLMIKPSFICLQMKTIFVPVLLIVILLDLGPRKITLAAIGIVSHWFCNYFFWLSYHWVSKLKSEMALSTCESKYVALCLCTWALLPLCHLLDDITKWLLEPNWVSSFQSQKCYHHLAALICHPQRQCCLSFHCDWFYFSNWPALAIFPSSGIILKTKLSLVPLPLSKLISILIGLTVKKFCILWKLFPGLWFFLMTLQGNQAIFPWGFPCHIYASA